MPLKLRIVYNTECGWSRMLRFCIIHVCRFVISTFNNSFLTPVAFQTYRNEEFESSFVVTFIKEVYDTYKVHKTTFRKEAVSRTQSFELYLLLNNGKFCLGLEGLVDPSPDRTDVNVGKCVNDADRGLTMS